MDSLIGLQGKDFVLIAADRGGEIADRQQFGEFIQKNIHLYKLRTSITLSTSASAHFCRQQLARFLRSSPYAVNLLIGGIDTDGPKLYWCDYLGSCVSVKKGAHGYAGYFVEGLLDKYYRENMEQEEAINILNKCIQELKQRFIISQTQFSVYIVQKDGVREIQI